MNLKKSKHPNINIILLSITIIYLFLLLPQDILLTITNNWLNITLLQEDIYGLHVSESKMFRNNNSKIMNLPREISSYIPLIYAYYLENNFENINSLFSQNNIICLNSIEAYWYGLALSKLGDKEKSGKIWQSHNIIKNLSEGALNSIELGNFKDAQNKYELILTVDPNNDEVWFELGKILWKVLDGNQEIISNENTDPIKEIGNAFYYATKIKPDNPDYLNWWGYYQFIYLNDIPGAILNLEKSVQLYKDGDVWAYYRLGMVYQAAGQPDRAFKALEQSYRLDHDNQAPILKEYSKALYSAGYYNQAVEIGKKAVESSLDRSDVHYLLSIYYAKICNIVEANNQKTIADKLDVDHRFQYLADRAITALNEANNCQSP